MCLHIIQLKYGYYNQYTMDFDLFHYSVSIGTYIDIKKIMTVLYTMHGRLSYMVGDMLHIYMF